MLFKSKLIIKIECIMPVLEHEEDSVRKQMNNNLILSEVKKKCLEALEVDECPDCLPLAISVQEVKVGIYED